MTDSYTAYDAARLPSVVLAYLDAHDEGRYDDAKATFAKDATVIDDGKTYRGIDEIGAWIERSAGEYEYTSTRIGQTEADTTRPVVRIRLDGNFPGNTVTLRYCFEVDAGLIARLTIGDVAADG
ncbi:nuclear transport factor 2 family protein [Amycolatopsis roodepoortensis]|uniref:SnoaL-like domain-containing protein n=1 Tax=Amycolatopsis roodepoortensis TaxID=700274 RepID=A0ABR9KYQ3_9PSEU|nr:nuclear transport factor 2 family protein [Amycolatopsis roodepoortensis]MBE1573494.1 hypothetical protein [Amycolatopsis roodepoortensis]